MDTTTEPGSHNLKYTPPSLRKLREATGLSQGDVAQRLEVSQQAVAKWERLNDAGEKWAVLASLYDVGEDYPFAPFDPKRRHEAFKKRNEMIAAGGAAAHFRKVEENRK